MRTTTPAGDQALILSAQATPSGNSRRSRLRRGMPRSTAWTQPNARAPPRRLDELRAKFPGVDAFLMHVLIAEVRRLSAQLSEALYLPTESRV